MVNSKLFKMERNAMEGSKEIYDDSLELDEQLSALGLSCDPFSEHDFPKVFMSKAHQDTLEKLMHFAHFSDTSIVITGQIGVGKTTLKNQFLVEAENSGLFVLTLRANLMFSGERIVTNIAEQLDLAVENLSPSEILQIIRQDLAEINQTQRCVLVIDDAQQLDVEVLEVLRQLSFFNGSHNLCIVLFGDDSLLEVASATSWLDITSEEVHLVELSPLNEDQTAQYLDHRLELAGSSDLGFSNSVKKRIYEHSKGIPVMINRFGREALLRTLSGKNSKAYAFPMMHIATISAVGVALIALIYFGQSSSDSGYDDASLASNDYSTDIIEREIPVRVSTDKKLGIDANTFNQDKAADGYKADSSAHQAQNTPSTSTFSQLSDGNNDSDRLSPIAQAVKQNSVQQRNNAPQLTNRAATKKPSDNEPAELELTAVDVNTLAAPGSIYTGNNTPKPKSVAKSPSTKTASSTKTTTKTSAPTQVASRSVTRKITDKTNNVTADENWLLGLSPRHYTLQLLGARDESKVKALIQSHKAVKELAYYKTWLNGKPWYVVVQGSYESKAQAAAAAAGLPAPLRAQQPWARSLKEVQATLSKLHANT